MDAVPFVMLLVILVGSEVCTAFLCMCVCCRSLCSFLRSWCLSCASFLSESDSPSVQPRFVRSTVRTVLACREPPMVWPLLLILLSVPLDVSSVRPRIASPGPLVVNVPFVRSRIATPIPLVVMSCDRGHVVGAAVRVRVGVRGWRGCASSNVKDPHVGHDNISDKEN